MKLSRIDLFYIDSSFFSDKFWKNKFQIKIFLCFRNATIQVGDQWDDFVPGSF